MFKKEDCEVCDLEAESLDHLKTRGRTRHEELIWGLCSSMKKNVKNAT